MSSAPELEGVQQSLDDLHARLQEILGYASIIVGCAQSDDMLRDFSESVVKSAEQAAACEQTLHERLGELRRVLATPRPASDPLLPPGAPLVMDGADPGPATVIALEVERRTPAARAPAPEAPPDFTGISISNPEGTKELILVVDHDQRSLNLADALLTSDGYRVIPSSDGFAALEIYRSVGGAIDLVIIDVVMPNIGGEEIFDEIRALRPGAAVVVSGGFSEPERISTMLKKGLNGFIPKPYKQERLLRQLQAVLLRRRKTAVVLPVEEEWRSY